MTDPHLIFQVPEHYKAFITSKNPEGQFFDRKEIRNDQGKQLEDARKNIIETISAFTNSRGGILILGIDDSGNIKGLDHLNENEYNSLSNTVSQKLKNHLVRTKEFLSDGKKLLIFYCPVGNFDICSTIEAHPRAWIRNCASNTPMSPEQQHQLYLERGKSFEQLPAIEYNISLIDKDILRVFQSRHLEEQGSTQSYSEIEFLRAIGAVRSENGKDVLTNAGLLFFGNRPTAQIPQSTLRILKFECESKDYQSRGNPIFDRSYDGCLPQLLLKIRTFIKEAAFFKTYTFRDPDGSGIIDEPELPIQAVEEAIVNAIIHRDYSMSPYTECTLYKDVLLVRNPGKLLQADFIPIEFSLDQLSLYHYPRNPTLVAWAKTMRDENGQRFVKALSEGYRTMRDQMNQFKLPSPQYKTNGYTTVYLFNNYIEREAKIKKLQSSSPGEKESLPDELTNLFEIELKYEDPSDLRGKILSSTIVSLIKDKLQNLKWFIDRDNKSRIIAHQRNSSIPIDQSIDSWIRIFPAYSFQVHFFDSKHFLSIDYDVQIKNVATLDKLIQKGITDLRFRKAQVKVGGQWTFGIIQDFTDYYASVHLPEFDKTEHIRVVEIIPYLNKSELNAIAKQIKPSVNLESKLKLISLSSVSNAAKQRLEKILHTAEYISNEVFPLSYAGFQANLKHKPKGLEESVDELKPFTVIHSLKEPAVRFGDDAVETNILSGLAKFGSYGSPNKDIEIVPFCMSGCEEKMVNLINTLKTGSMNFKGLERTFKIGVKHLPLISKSNAYDFLSECKRLLNEYRWEGDKNLSRIFLMHIPEDLYASTDINSPYFALKEFLLEKGIPVQMVDTPTLNEPKYKDFNLALNIVAKTGGTPWVLPAALPESDIFIGLSYAQYKDAEQLYRTMGYANVFDRYGQWKFFKGNVASFDFESKHIHLANLVKETLQKRENLPVDANINIHYSSKFSKLDREFILKAVHSVRPKAIVNFVWINIGHNIRMFDNRIQGNGSLSRGTFVITRVNQLFLSTTGYNVIKKTLGTPIMLEINVHTEPFNPNQKLQYRVIAQHILALTKLNWASTQTINGEPVTTKYAHDIARISQVFYRRKGEFKLHPVLEETPWFI